MLKIRDEEAIEEKEEKKNEEKEKRRKRRNCGCGNVGIPLTRKLTKLISSCSSLTAHQGKARVLDAAVRERSKGMVMTVNVKTTGSERAHTHKVT